MLCWHWSALYFSQFLNLQYSIELFHSVHSFLSFFLTPSHPPPTSHSFFPLFLHFFFPFYPFLEWMRMNRILSCWMRLNGRLSCWIRMNGRIFWWMRINRWLSFWMRMNGRLSSRIRMNGILSSRMRINGRLSWFLLNANEWKIILLDKNK